MRSRREIAFRLRQELANLRLLLAPPRPMLEAQAPLCGLPDPEEVARVVRGTPAAERLERLADRIVERRFSLLGLEFEPGSRIAWRRDYRSGIETGTSYFRLVPYLDAGRVGDHKLIWELNRHQHLVVLAQAFVCWGREEYLREIFAELESWWEENPLQRGINWASALEVAFRALSWIWVFHLVGHRMPDDFRRRFLLWLYWHGCHLEANLSIYFSPNTHLLGEAVALHALGRLLARFPEAARWEHSSGASVEAEIGRQVRDDGSHFEQSSYYHLYALDMFLLHAVLGSPGAGGQAPPQRPGAGYLQKLERMAGYLAALMGPGRSLPFLGDDDGGRVFHPYGDPSQFGRATLATCAVVAGAPCRREDVFDQALWWIGPAALERVSDAGPEDTPASRWFPGAGVAVLAGGQTQVIVDAGGFGPGSGGHSHSDTLSLVARHGEREVLIDPGTYTYVAEPDWRAWFRGAAAHNTLRIDGRDQGAPAGPFRWTHPPRVAAGEWRSDARRDLIEGRCEFARFVHRRRVWLRKSDSLLLILDELSGPEGEHLVEQFWHPGEPCVMLSPRRFRIGDCACLVVGPLGALEFGFGGQHGWRSPMPGVKLEAPAIVVRWRGRLPVRFRAAVRFAPVECYDSS
ncbi:MAG: alginate lyase family protein [Bryobacterales bacterium]|nr:alginate lyase family protein [Bryobacterales bacterium]